MKSDTALMFLPILLMIRLTQIWFYDSNTM